MARERSVWVRLHRMTGCLIRCAGLLLAASALSVEAAQTDIPGPAGSGAFGTTVTVLPNGNIVVTDPFGQASNVGAVYLYSPSGVLISTLTGSSAGDLVGQTGITVLRNGNYVIQSPFWNNGLATSAGAVTWADGRNGVSGVVSSANSLIGSTTNDWVGFGVLALSNGHYVVSSPNLDNGGAENVGAVTWASGSTGLSGVISPSNSLIGTTANDRVGDGGVTGLSNGNYVVVTNFWGSDDVGAVTWADGSTGLAGLVSPANSLVGTTNGDFIGLGVTALNNGNYVIRGYSWDNGATVDVGAATWANGTTGLVGEISSANSLIGTTAFDNVGGRVTALSNGNYVVISHVWGSNDVGAVTWADGSTGLAGVVSSANSLVGTTLNDTVGDRGVTALSNGNYVVQSLFWNNGAIANTGAATWANGSTGLAGVVSPANSLVGTTDGDLVGAVVTALNNGNYVVGSAQWDNGVTGDVGAATWANGSTGLAGAVSPANSLVGMTDGDSVGIGVSALTNGNYVIRSSSWDNGATVDVGAATWANGSTGLAGVVSPANSLIGTTALDRVGLGVTSLSNGNYVVVSWSWDHGATVEAGAVTWADGSTGLSGIVTPANSLIGSSEFDVVGSPGDTAPGVTALRNGDYVVNSQWWDDDITHEFDVGAMTLALGDSGSTGNILAANSVRGTVANRGNSMVFGYDAAREQLVVGRPASNIVSLFRLSSDLIFTNGFE